MREARCVAESPTIQPEVTRLIIGHFQEGILIADARPTPVPSGSCHRSTYGCTDHRADTPQYEGQPRGLILGSKNACSGACKNEKDKDEFAHRYSCEFRVPASLGCSSTWR